MKIRIVIKIKMDCEKCRSKALKIAAEVKGVISVSLDGDDKDRLVVIGDNVDTICLAKQLQKKFQCVTILIVEQVKPPPPPPPPSPPPPSPPKDKKKKEPKKECCAAILCLPAPPPQCTKQCETKCEHCTKCQTPKCQCKCAHTCSKCHSKSCDGNNCVIICFKCQNPKCSGQCSSSPCKPPPPTQPPCYNIIQCPPWCTCIKCYVPYCPPPPPCPYWIVYDQYNSDTCSIQ